MPSTPPRTPDRIASLTEWALAHRRRVVALWLAAAVLGLFAFPIVTASFSEDPPAPRGSAAAVNQTLEQRFGASFSAPLVAVVRLEPSADPAAVRGDLRRFEQRISRALPGVRLASYASTGDRAFLSADGRTTFVLAYPPDADDEQRDLDAALRVAARTTVAGAPVALTGRALLERDADEAADPTVLVETVVAATAALAVLVFVFASPLALVPLAIAAVAIPSTFLAVGLLMLFADVSFVVLFLVTLIGLGLAIDYALIIVTRWREEHDRGASPEEAARVAAQTAGRAVVSSGCAVGIGLLAAITLPVPFLRAMGFAGLLIPLVSVAAALTLLPVLLVRFGPRADRHRIRRTERAQQRWATIARGVVRRRWVALGAGAATLAALCAVASGQVVGSPPADALPGTPAARAALTTLERGGIGAGPLAPIPALGPEASRNGAARELANAPGVRSVIVPAGATWQRGGQALALVIPEADTYSSAGRDTVAAVRDAAARTPGVEIGGWAAEDADFVSDLYRSLPVMIGCIALVTFVLLARAFRSLLLPLKAIVLNLASVFAAWGLVALVWQHGFGTALLGAEPTGSVISWVPVMTFAFLYGLSMDYEVFTLARIREEHDRIGDTDGAIVAGISHTGRLVTSAALIVFFAFATMGAAGATDVKMLATGLAGGILLDALVVRTLLVPATVSLLGRWNWWFPEPARRVLRVPPVRRGRAPAASPGDVRPDRRT
jgi:RND superfamily putative drug exporter